MRPPLGFFEVLLCWRINNISRASQGAFNFLKNLFWTRVTKGDKISRGARRGTLEKYIRSGLRSIDVPIITSAEKGDGIDELKNFISRHLSEKHTVLPGKSTAE